MSDFPDLFHRLAECRRPIAIWGTGDGADKLFAVLKRINVRPSAVFASDGFVRDRSFHSFPVLSYADVCREYPDCTVLLAFGSRLPEVIGNVRRVAAERELYVPDLPVAGETLFDAAFVAEHRGEFDEARSLLADEASRRLFDSIITARLHGDLPSLEAAV